ncbi:UDP-N-acetylenolpyruvoylglucosamine reductase [Porphyromonadaceae bacterium COT-184 OH4590]|nr:UDP-N-acetylenolpyruvoylglucosamine reductase [Porphyromonadaceae bacterium COT-184 OH4590]
MIKHNYSLLRHNSFGFDIKANHFFDYKTKEQLKEFLKDVRGLSNKLLHIGEGSNLLFTSDFEGTILHSSIKSIHIQQETDSHVFIRVGSGVVFDDFCQEMTELNFGGIENLSLIPGQVGAAAIQNIGAYGVEIKDVIVEVEAIEIDTLHWRKFSALECQYDYRSSIFKTELNGKYIITDVVFRLNKHSKPNIEYIALRNEFADDYEPSIQEVREAVIRIRTSKLPDPKQFGNAGSFFKNPYCSRSHYEKLCREYSDIPHYNVSENLVKIPAAYLIEKCGFKGKRVGNVGAYTKQPLVLVNYGGASPNEIIELAQAIETKVQETFGILLEREVIYV